MFQSEHLKELSSMFPVASVFYPCPLLDLWGLRRVFSQRYAHSTKWRFFPELCSTTVECTYSKAPVQSESGRVTLISKVPCLWNNQQETSGRLELMYNFFEGFKSEGNVTNTNSALLVLHRAEEALCWPVFASRSCFDWYLLWLPHSSQKKPLQWVLIEEEA